MLVHSTFKKTGLWRSCHGQKEMGNLQLDCRDRPAGRGTHPQSRHFPEVVPCGSSLSVRLCGQPLSISLYMHLLEAGGLDNAVASKYLKMPLHYSPFSRVSAIHDSNVPGQFKGLGMGWASALGPHSPDPCGGVARDSDRRAATDR